MVTVSASDRSGKSGEDLMHLAITGAGNVGSSLRTGSKLLGPTS